MLFHCSPLKAMTQYSTKEALLRLSALLWKEWLSTPALSTLLLSSSWCVFREVLALSPFLCFLVLIFCTFELEWRMTVWPVRKKKKAKKAVVAQNLYYVLKANSMLEHSNTIFHLFILYRYIYFSITKKVVMHLTWMSRFNCLFITQDFTAC